jgi:hypothetical protein
MATSAASIRAQIVVLNIIRNCKKMTYENSRSP